MIAMRPNEVMKLNEQNDLQTSYSSTYSLPVQSTQKETISRSNTPKCKAEKSKQGCRVSPCFLFLMLGMTFLLYFPSKEVLDPEDRLEATLAELVFERYNWTQREDRPGLSLSHLEPYFPVVIIPGIISTGL